MADSNSPTNERGDVSSGDSTATETPPSSGAPTMADLFGIGRERSLDFDRPSLLR